jgi:light-regulated signal transduction histidine kinase (bacteriophytochrome)
VTEVKNAELQLLQLNESLKKQTNELALSNAELEQFAFVASHDLQEPLRMITSFLAQLEKKYNDQIDDRGKQYIHFAVDGAKRMRQIILDLLEYSRVGRINTNFENVNTEKIIDDVLALYKSLIEETGATITINKLPVVHTDYALLRQTFHNLIGNGLKYKKTGVKPEIVISCEDKSDYWLFSVSDNGIGIDAEYFDQIFIIFKRLHTREEFPGTGMGLAITKKIVENMGGEISVASQKDKGSTFYFTIPKNNAI